MLFVVGKFTFPGCINVYYWLIEDCDGDGVLVPTQAYAQEKLPLNVKELNVLSAGFVTAGGQIHVNGNLSRWKKSDLIKVPEPASPTRPLAAASDAIGDTTRSHE